MFHTQNGMCSYQVLMFTTEKTTLTDDAFLTLYSAMVMVK